MKREGNAWKKIIAKIAMLFLVLSIFGSTYVSLAAEPKEEKAYPQVKVDEIVWDGGDIEIPLDLGGISSSDLLIRAQVGSDGSRWAYATDCDSEKAILSILEYFDTCDEEMPISETGNYQVTVEFLDKNSGEIISTDIFTLVNPVTSQLWDVSYEIADFDGTQDVIFHFDNGTNYYKLEDIPSMNIYTPMNPIPLDKGTDYTVNMVEGTVTIDKGALANALNQYFTEGYVFFEDTIAVNAVGTTVGGTTGFYMNRVNYVGEGAYMTDTAWQIDISKFTPGEPEDTEDISGEFIGSNNTAVKVSEEDAAVLKTYVLNYVDNMYKEELEGLGECSVTSVLKVDEQAIEEIDQDAREAFTDVAQDAVVGKYYDIRLMANVLKDGKEVEGLTDINIPELKQNINISLKIPSEMLNEGRTFKMLHYHNGKVEVLNSTVTGDTNSFETSAFSPFALAYVNEKGDSIKPGNGDNLPGDKQQEIQTSIQKGQKVTTPKTGDTNSIVLSIITGSLAVIIIVFIVIKKKRAA